MGKGDEIQRKFDGSMLVILSSDMQADIDQTIVPSSKKPLPAIPSTAARHGAMLPIAITITHETEGATTARQTVSLVSTTVECSSSKERSGRRRVLLLELASSTTAAPLLSHLCSHCTKVGACKNTTHRPSRPFVFGFCCRPRRR